MYNYRILKNAATPPKFKVQKVLLPDKYKTESEWEDCEEPPKYDHGWEHPIVIRNTKEECLAYIKEQIELDKNETWTVVHFEEVLPG